MRGRKKDPRVEKPDRHSFMQAIKGSISSKGLVGSVCPGHSVMRMAFCVCDLLLNINKSSCEEKHQTNSN
jgi:hypothetical protein